MLLYNLLNLLYLLLLLLLLLLLRVLGGLVSTDTAAHGRLRTRLVIQHPLTLDERRQRVVADSRAAAALLRPRQPEQVCRTGRT